MSQSGESQSERAIWATPFLSPSIVLDVGTDTSVRVELTEDDDGALSARVVEDAAEGQLGIAFPGEPRQLELGLRTKNSQIAKTTDVEVLQDSSRLSELIQDTNATSSHAVDMPTKTAGHVEKYPGFAGRLRKRRLELEMSLLQVSNESGLAYGTLLGWEKKRQDPQEHKARKLTGVLQVEVDWLLYGDDEESEHGNDHGEDPEGGT